MTREEFISRIESEQRALRGFLLALCCGNRDDADDLAQDTLVKAYLSSVGSGYFEQGKFRSWLFKIAHNTFLDYIARCQEASDIEEAEDMIGNTDADASFQHQELYMALKTLPPKERSSIVMYYFNDYSIREISQITDSSEDAVKKQLSRGREKLKAILQYDER